MEAETLIKEYLPTGKTMQIATVQDGRPWICTVYYVADELQRLYWLSLPSRKHSRQLANDDKAAIAIAIKADKPVIGIQAEGCAEPVQEPGEVKHVMQLYAKKYDGAGLEFYDNFVEGTNQHVLYRFTPSLYVLFDEVTFDASESRKEWPLGAD
jgi:uncharacterized protein YhbP (UPF0306 family)